ncbi:acetate/propionate family kinase [Heliophilum fasciatum]|uniref:Acetate kinase n=1 Tax=Heliophilum fasciatum TaxID=35700 RepID=A0A4R2RUS8_9FIRM|nr:acetate kinase [Heliophilum fasciatum]MCW2278410.1 acetate kinase [Heliophilum fasciatum]TCP63691.1 acetate kinase [Heliophilum fasciatum]
MIVLVINSGSSSLKYQLFDMGNETMLAKGLIERIGMPGSLLTHRPSGQEPLVIRQAIADHMAAIALAVKALTEPNHGVIASMQAIEAIGHRVAHGGDRFTDAALIDKQVMAAIVSLFPVAPLHNPPAVMGIEACQQMLPAVPQIAVFDTAFHQSIPEAAYMYALPWALHEKYNLRRYGFHGTSHRFVARRLAALMQKPLEALKIITCHLGNGSSLCAVDRGQSIDTTMGFTPLEGLMMGTRVGDIDPAAVLFIMEHEGYTSEQVRDFLNKRCGVLGVSGLSSDFRDLEREAQQGNARCRLALDMFAYRVKKYIGAYTAAMNGLDALVFTAGIGENSAMMRAKICADLTYLGIAVDEEKNIRDGEGDISAVDSRCRVFVIPTNEELMIAQDTFRIARENA